MARGFMRVLVCGVILGLGLAGCGPIETRDPVPEALLDRAEIKGLPASVRTWGDQVDPAFQARCFGSAIEQRRIYYANHPEDPQPPTVDILCISGGGEDGAFGAGLLNGWTARGDRPKFMLVTGISTGAMSAPMAFLGRPYDQRLTDAYTKVTQNDLFRMKSIFSLLRSDSLADNKPMVKMLERYIDAQMLEEVAREHARGRRLLVATTNLDAQRPVIWDMGAIASSNYPKKLELFRKILLASASIPGVFPPVYLNVEVAGKKYNEMHVDGGTTSQVFLWGQGVDIAQMMREHQVQKVLPTRLFVIRNAKMDPEYDPIRAYLPEIAGRSVSTLIKSQGRGDVLRLYNHSRSYDFEFNLASIPPTFTEKLNEPFETRYMNKLYAFGYGLGKAGYHWEKLPPGVLTPSPATTRPASVMAR